MESYLVGSIPFLEMLFQSFQMIDILLVILGFLFQLLFQIFLRGSQYMISRWVLRIYSHGPRTHLVHRDPHE